MLALSNWLTVPTLKPMLASWVCRAVTPTVPVARPCPLTSDRLSAPPPRARLMRGLRRVDDAVFRLPSDDPMVNPASGLIRLTDLRVTASPPPTNGKALRWGGGAENRTAG